MVEQSRKSKTRTWLKGLFVVSLTLNVLILGAIAGAVWRHGGPEARVRGPGGAPAILRALKREDRRDVLRTARAAGRSARKDRTAQDAQMIAVLSATPLDVTALDALMAAQQEVAFQRIAAVSQAWRVHVMAMTQAQRADYVERLKELPTHKPPKSDR